MGPVLKRLSKISLLLIGLLSTLFLMFSSPASAQANCGERKEIATILEDRYAEKPVATGMSQGGGVVEVFAARDGSWTMIVTMPSGYACFMAAGEDWENLSVLAQGTKI
tara:strand:- start:228 stop:554 length:327 start_codon:yes stop_codon:yes gene_type:complete